jgi:hypothetical protein
MRVRYVDANFDWFGGSTGSTRGLLGMEIILRVNARYASQPQDRENSRFRPTGDKTPTLYGVTTSANTKADRLAVWSAYLPS